MKPRYFPSGEKNGCESPFRTRNDLRGGLIEPPPVQPVLFPAERAVHQAAAVGGKRQVVGPVGDEDGPARQRDLRPHRLSVPPLGPDTQSHQGRHEDHEQCPGTRPHEPAPAARAGRASLRRGLPALRDASQFLRHVVRALAAGIGILRETGRHQPLEGGRRDGLQRTHRGRLARHDRRDDARLALAGKCAAAGQHLVEHAPEREQVRARVGVFPLELLRRHVGHGAQDGARRRHRSLGRQRRHPAGHRGRAAPSASPGRNPAAWPAGPRRDLTSMTLAGLRSR